MLAISKISERVMREQLEDWLIRWGSVFGEERPAEWDEGPKASVPGGPSVHPIARAMEFAPNGRDKGQLVSYGIGYRAEPAARSGRVPREVCYGSPTRSFSASAPSGVGSSVSPVILQIERAAVDLFRIDTERGLVLRYNYCRRGTQKEKVEWINQSGPFVLTLRTYRDHLAHARTWVEARIS